MDKIGVLLKTNKLAKVLELILVFLIAILFIKAFSQLESDNLILNQAIIWVANIIMLIMVWAGLKLRGENWGHFGLSFRKIPILDALKVFGKSLLVFLLALTGFVIGSIIMANITGIPEGADFSGYDYLKDNIWMLALTLVGVYIVSSIGEEVVYRGFLINRFMELGLSGKSGKILAVTLSAIVFALAHYSWGPMGMAQTGFMGLALGICYLYYNKNLWILILAHAYMDTILMVQMYLASN